jgi:septum formation protein
MIRLCSSSETRAKLLNDFGVDFVQSGVDFDEDSIVASSAKDFVYLASVGKLQKAEMIYALELPLLSADTVVVGANGEILRKAKDEEDARYILSVQRYLLSQRCTIRVQNFISITSPQPLISF